MPLKPFSRAKHVGRATSRFSFELSALNIESGLPANLSATGIILQCSRGPKIASTKEVEFTAEMKAACGDISWEAQKLSFVATLFASKSGKSTGYSDKRYKIAVMAVKPTFGTSKKQLKEIAMREINISDYAVTEQPQPLTLQLDRRAHDGNPIVLHCTLTARAAKPGVGDEDDDDQSMSSAITGLSGLAPGSETTTPSGAGSQALEQDLEGFSEALAASSQNMFTKSKAREKPPKQNPFDDSPVTSPAAKPKVSNPFEERAQQAPPPAVVVTNPFGGADEKRGPKAEETRKNPFESAEPVVNEPARKNELQQGLDDLGRSLSKGLASLFGGGTETEDAHKAIDDASAAKKASTEEAARAARDQEIEAEFGDGSVPPPLEEAATASGVVSGGAAARSPPKRPLRRQIGAAEDEDEQEDGRPYGLPAQPPKPLRRTIDGDRPSPSGKVQTNPFADPAPSGARRDEDAAHGSGGASAGAGAGAGVGRDQLDLDEFVAMREELSFTREQLARAQDELRRSQQESRSTRADAEQLAADRRAKLSASLAECNELRDQLKARDAERGTAVAKLESALAGAEAARAAAEAEVVALRAQLDSNASVGSNDERTSVSAIDAAAAAATAAANAEAAEELALLRAQAANAQRQASQAEERYMNVQAAAEDAAHEAEEERRQLRAELEATLARADALEAGGASPAAPGGDGSEEVEQLSAQLIEAKMAAAQHAFERDEATAAAKRLRAELERVGGGTRKLGERATKLEVKYEDLRQKYDLDLASLIESRLQAAEAVAKVAEYEAQYGKL